MIRAAVFALLCAASVLVQGPAREKYHPVKVEKIYSYPEVPVYVYLLSGGEFCTMNIRLDVKEGSEVKTASLGQDVYLMDSDGKIYKCKFIAFGDGAVAPPNKK